MSWLNDLKRAIKRFGELETPRAERRHAPGLGAQYGVESPNLPATIKDISTSGIYLFTEKRLNTGEVVTLVLRQEGDPESSAETQFSVHAQVVRQGEDGIGLSFVLPPGLDVNLWGVLVRNIVTLTNREEIAEMFRTLRTILFLCRLCESGAEESILLLGGGLHPDRTATIINIALAAENQLATMPDGERMHAHPKLVASILLSGSWAIDEFTVQLWAGLLVTSCSLESPDDSNQIFVDLLVQLTPTQSRIYSLGCRRVLGLVPAPLNASADSIVITPKQMIELTNEHDLNRAKTDIAYLYNLGLIRKNFDFTSYQDVEDFDITPSELGIELYKHCHGSREPLAPELLDSAKTHLSNFIPPPQKMTFDGPDDRTPLPTYTPE
jgi:hypothetical protein